MGASINILNSDENFIPTSTLAGAKVADQTLSVSSTAVAMIATDLSDLTTHVLWTTDGDAARYTLDGTGPTSTVGHYVPANSTGIWHRDRAIAAKWIRVTGDVNLHISELSS